MAKRFKAACQSRIGIVHFLEILAIALVEEALRRSQTEDDGAVGCWQLFRLSCGLVVVGVLHCSVGSRSHTCKLPELLAQMTVAVETTAPILKAS